MSIVPSKGIVFSFRLVAFLEGISYLVLLGVAMPMKYMFGDPGMIRPVGMAHGLLFIAYVLIALQVKAELGWDGKTLVKVLLASVIPFGTFWVDTRLLRPVPAVEG